MLYQEIRLSFLNLELIGLSNKKHYWTRIGTITALHMIQNDYLSLLFALLNHNGSKTQSKIAN